MFSFKELEEDKNGLSPEETGVYCFVDNVDKLVFANITNNIKKGEISHKQKLESGSHRDKRFLQSYNCGNITYTFFPTKDWEEARSVIEKLRTESGYEVVTL